MNLEQRLVEDFGAVYRDHRDAVVAFCFRRTHDPELAAELTAEVFAAALAGRDRYQPSRGTVRQWLLGIAAHKAVDAARRGQVDRRAQRSLGMTAIAWTDEDFARVERLGTTALDLIAELPQDQASAVRARVLDEREYHEIARAQGVSEQVARKRVSRGLATMRRRLKGQV